MNLKVGNETNLDVNDVFLFVYGVFPNDVLVFEAVILKKYEYTDIFLGCLYKIVLTLLLKSAPSVCYTDFSDEISIVRIRKDGVMMTWKVTLTVSM